MLRRANRGVPRRRGVTVVALGALTILLAACVPVQPPPPPPPPAPPACTGRPVTILGDSIVGFAPDRVRALLASRGYCIAVYDAQSGRTIGEHVDIAASLATRVDAIVFSFGVNEAREIGQDLTLTQSQARAAFMKLLDDTAAIPCVRFLSVQTRALGVSPNFRGQLVWYNAMIRDESRPGYGVADFGPRVDANIDAWWPVEGGLPSELRRNLWVYGPEVAFGGQFHLVEDRGGIDALADSIADAFDTCTAAPVPSTSTTSSSSTTTSSSSTSTSTTTTTTTTTTGG